VDQEGIDLANALNRFLKFVGDLPLVSYAAGFDMAFLSKALQQCHPERTLNNPVVCAMQLARRAWPFLPSLRLADVAGGGASFAEPPHRAVGDCERALLVYLAAVQELQKLR
jgi:DNA polymerase III epsilon subunit-like protein